MKIATKYAYMVTIEWMLKGKDETWNPETLNVVAATAEKAIEGAIKNAKDGFGEELHGVRLKEIKRVEGIDLIL